MYNTRTCIGIGSSEHLAEGSVTTPIGPEKVDRPEESKATSFVCRKMDDKGEVRVGRT